MDNSEKIRARLDCYIEWGGARADDLICALLAVLDLCDAWEAWWEATYDDLSVHCSGTVMGRVDDVRRAIAEELGVTE